MPQVPAEKSYFTFAGGLNTDASLIAFPEESTSDEANFELLRDGSRRRRRGLDQESSGVTHTLATTLGTSDVVSHVKWRDAGTLGNNFIVVQSGSNLIFYADSLTPSSSILAAEIDLLTYKVAAKSAADVSQNKVSMTVGHRSRLIVTGRYLEPFYVEWDGSVFTTRPINIKERDFIGIIDDINVVTFPPTATSEHTYNLRARGWKQANITTFASAKSKQPAKNMWPWRGYRRTNVAGIAEEDGTYAFSADKMDAGLFGDASSALGHLIHNPFNTTTTGLVGGVDFIDSYTCAWPTPTVTITAAAHGLTNGTVIVIQDNLYYYTGVSYPIGYTGSLNGTYTINTATTNTFNIVANEPYDYPGGTPVSISDGSFYISTGTEVITNPSPFTTNERPQLTIWYAGRAWYLGINDAKLKDKIYFTRVIEDASHYGHCFQVADPTDPDHNELVSTDGGFILIPDLGTVQGATIFNESLLVFTTNGVWQIGGARGIFSADNYAVRKLSDFSATSKYSVISCSDSVYWTGYEGIYKLFQDPQTGYLTAVNVSQDKIQVLWNGLPEATQARVRASYDKSAEKVYFIYPSDSTYALNRYNHCLVYSIRQEAYYKLVFPSALANYIVDIFSTTTTEESEASKNIKFLVQTATRTQLKVCDMDQTDFVDFDGAEQVPYMVAGYDNLGDFQRYKQAPVLHVYCKKTETGYTASGTDLVPIDESSVLLRPIWDWSDNSNSGKYGPQQQVYRHRRYYQPVDVTDTFNDGYPVVVTRNKLKGRGRVLHLRIDGEEGKHAHILGWSILYKANRKV